MAYIPLNFAKSSMGSMGVLGVDEYVYDGEDDAGTVSAANYFTDALQKGVSVGDCVCAREWAVLPNSNAQVPFGVGHILDAAASGRPDGTPTPGIPTELRKNDATITSVFKLVFTAIDEDVDSPTYGAGTAALTLATT